MCGYRKHRTNEKMELALLHQFLRLGLSALHVAAASASAALKSRATLQLENLALRHQLGVLRRSVEAAKLTSADRLLWIWLCEVWSDWRFFPWPSSAANRHWLHRKGFRLFRPGKFVAASLADRRSKVVRN